jgi:aspartyl-tRNA(Asn)/glutamyl-tRNA(Gln) amidotransferase subunit B
VKTHSNPKGISNWVMGDLFRVIKETKLDEKLRITAWPITPEHLAEIVRLVDQGKISGKMAKTLFEEAIERGESPETIAREKGLEQVTDLGEIEKAVQQILDAHPQQVSDYRGGKEKVFGFLVGQVMKTTQGKASPQMVNEILKKKLGA